MKKVAIIRGLSLSKWEMQNCEPLMKYFDVTAYTTNPCKYDITGIELPVVQVPFQSNGLTLYMEELEYHLSEMDLVYTGDISYLYSAQAIEAKRKYGCKVVCLEWENIPFNFEDNDAVRKIREQVRNEADHFIAVTGRAKEALMLEGVPEEKIDVIPMGIDLSRFRSNEMEGKRYREHLGIRHNEMMVFFAGRMEWEKGVYDFVNAAVKVIADQKRKGLTVKFVMSGSGSELGELRKRIINYGINDSFIYIENCPYDEIHKLHNAADIFVLPSIPTRNWQEQLGMVLVESMACAKPVISTLSGSIPEVVGDTGMLVQPNDYLALYTAITTLIDDEMQRGRLGKKARARAEEHFDSKRIASAIKEIFDKVLCSSISEQSLKDIYCKGLSLRDEGKLEDALESVCDVFNKDPDNDTFLGTLVEMAVETNQMELAEISLRRHLLLHPANLSALYELSKILLAMGKFNESEEELNKIFIFDPEREDANKLKEQIAKERHQLQESL